MLLHYTATGSGKPIVLLHGMAGSSRYWKQFIHSIEPGHRIIALDLLGFGQSIKPDNILYSYDTHIQSIMDTLQSLDVAEPFTLVGHSMGALIALRLATTYSQAVAKLVLVAMPIYTTPDHARRSITNGSKLKQLAYYGTSSRILCNIWCRFLRPVSGRLAPKYLPHLTPVAAQDSVLHTWQAYSQSMENIIENQNTASDFAKFKKPIAVVYGDRDIPGDMDSVLSKLDGKNIKTLILPGTHQIINEQPQKLAEIILNS